MQLSKVSQDSILPDTDNTSESIEEEKKIQNRPLPKPPTDNKNSVMQLSEVSQNSILPATDNTSSYESIYEAVHNNSTSNNSLEPLINQDFEEHLGTNTSDYESIYEAVHNNSTSNNSLEPLINQDFEEYLDTIKSGSACESISALSSDEHKNNESIGSALKIWNSMMPRDKEILKNLDSYPVFNTIKSAIKESLGNENDCRYILAKFSFDSLITPYKKEMAVNENSDYLAMNEVKTHAGFDDLFEKMVLIVLQDLDDLFCISNSDHCHEKNDMLMKKVEPVYMNKPMFFEETRRKQEIPQKTLVLHQ